jgi:DNA polymerase elongation subunit (family B)
MLSLNKFFPYQWVIDEKEKEVTSIRVYGIDFEDKNVCVRINNFTPWVYIELPCDKEWTSTRAQILGNKIDEILGNNKPLKKTLLLREKLYNANIKIQNNNIEKKQFPYLFCTFSNVHDIKQLCYKVKKPIPIVGIGLVKIKVHEQDADPILQLVSCKNIKTAGWIEFSGNEILGNEKITLCDKEYVVKWKNLKNYECDIIGKPKVMGFDIEVNSTNVTAMPKSEKPGDKIFQISCVFAREGSLNQDSYLLTLGKADNVGENVNIYCYETEADLLLGFTKLVRTENPNVIVGYNILGFDIQYMIDRAKFNLCLNTFDIMGFHKYNHSKEKEINWSSSAYKNQEFSYLDAEGRLFVDLLPLVRRDYKLNKYDLGTVSEYFLGDQKKDLNAKGIFKCYRIGIKKNDNGIYGEKAIRAMNKCGVYCIQDSVLVMKLMDKLQTWVGLTEMACTFNTQIFTLYTQGQQIKVYSQVYKFCTYNNIVVEKDGYITKDTDRYVGAHVFPPVPGIYDRVLPFDFASLYPTTIIAYNIDYSTFVEDKNIPDSMCHVLSWSDHVSCDHDPKIIRKKELTKYIDNEKIILKELREKRDKTKDKIEKQKIIDKINDLVKKIKPYTDERSAIMKTISKNPMCEKRYYRFLKEPRGVIPTILQFLLDARKKTRAQIKENNKKIDISTDEEEIKRLKLLNIVLNKRQLAYKVSANSMYGAMGVKKGYLPFMPGAMCTCYLGRCNIEKVAEVIPKKYGGELVYGD